jgi:DNA ligase-1
MIKALNTLSNVAATASKKEKERLLTANDSEVLRKICLYTYSPFLTFRVKQIDLPDKYNDIPADVSEELFLLLDLLASHKITPTESRGLIKRLLAKCTEESAMWIARIIDRDLKIGCGVSTINKSFEDLIPDFKVMLAHPMVEPKSGDSNWHRVKYPAILSTKIDGMRCIAVCDSLTVRFYSREGLELLTLDHLIPQILALRPGTKFVLDGESVGVVYNPNCKTAKKHYDAGKNWKFAQGLSMTKSSVGTYTAKEMNECLGYVVWDVIDYDYFLSQGKKGSCKPLRYRKTELSGMFERQASPLRSVSLLPNFLANNQEEAIGFFKRAVANNEEGAMLNDIDGLYEFTRTYSMLKLKEFYTADLRVVDCFEGTKGTKNEGSLGTILVTDDDKISGKVMGGWDDDLGLNIWLRHLRGEMKGNIIELIYKELTTDNNMRHCVFVRERLDKTEISWG